LAVALTLVAVVTTLAPLASRELQNRKRDQTHAVAPGYAGFMLT
jgi:hypothetical protein